MTLDYLDAWLEANNARIWVYARGNGFEVRIETSVVVDYHASGSGAGQSLSAATKQAMDRYLERAEYARSPEGRAAAKAEFEHWVHWK